MIVASVKPDAVMVSTMVTQALAEDVGVGDISAQLIAADMKASAQIITRESAVVCGQAWVAQSFAAVDDQSVVSWLVEEGAAVAAETVLCDIRGRASSLLTAERTALNFLQLLSGVATKTRTFVDVVAPFKATILDTRKTIPGWRAAQKYAVRCGGGQNHRMGLYDAFLIKENHIASCGSIAAAVAKAREHHPEVILEVEVESLAELQQAMAAGVSRVLLDNFSLEQLGEAVELADGNVALEASGGIDLPGIVAVAETGVDYISLGCLTKHIRAVDLSMRLVTVEG